MQRFRATFPVAISAYCLSLLAGAPVASADAPAGLVNTPRSATWSPSQAVSALLADGDDIRARALPAIAH